MRTCLLLLLTLFGLAACTGDLRPRGALTQLPAPGSTCQNREGDECIGHQ